MDNEQEISKAFTTLAEQLQERFPGFDVVRHDSANYIRVQYSIPDDEQKRYIAFNIERQLKKTGWSRDRYLRVTYGAKGAHYIDENLFDKKFKGSRLRKDILDKGFKVKSVFDSIQQGYLWFLESTKRKEHKESREVLEKREQNKFMERLTKRTKLDTEKYPYGNHIFVKGKAGQYSLSPYSDWLGEDERVRVDLPKMPRNVALKLINWMEKEMGK